MGHMKVRIIILLAALAVMVGPAVSASAATITFDAVPSVGNPILTSLVTDGFTFAGPHFHTVDDQFFGLVSNGSPIYLASEAENDLGRPITMTRIGGGTFSLNQFDGAETFWTGNLWHYINLSGVQSGGGLLSAQFTLDGLADGLGGVPDFQTFGLTGWDNLVSVTFDGALVTGGRGGFSLDNITVDASVPDPGSSLLLLAIGLAGLRAWKTRLG
jgi:hypothetical protein